MMLAISAMALASLRRNLMRSALTTLGVVIGVGSVIAMVTLGRGATARVTSDISRLGRNLLVVVPGGDRRAATVGTARPFTLADVRAIREQAHSVREVSASTGSAARVVAGNRNYGTSVNGSDNAYLRVRDWPIAMGRQFSEGELRGGSSVCILGETVRSQLFGDGDPLGSVLRVSNVTCTVIGVLEAKGRATFGEDQDDFVMVPLLTYQRRIAGNDGVGAIFVSARRADLTDEAQGEVESILRQRRRVHEGDEDDFVVRDLREVAQVVGQVTAVLTTLFGAIAAVSLVVGGIGIMNVMLVSVTERTREIGLRMAIGATTGEVLLQFLLEAILLSCAGGLVGVVVGLAGSYGASLAMSLPFTFRIDVLLGAFVFSGLVGVFFGYYPARRASRLEPIEALRHE